MTILSLSNLLYLFLSSTLAIITISHLRVLLRNKANKRYIYFFYTTASIDIMVISAFLFALFTEIPALKYLAKFAFFGIFFGSCFLVYNSLSYNFAIRSKKLSYAPKIIFFITNLHTGSTCWAFINFINRDFSIIPLLTLTASFLLFTSTLIHLQINHAVHTKKDLSILSKLTSRFFYLNILALFFLTHDMIVSAINLKYEDSFRTFFFCPLYSLFLNSLLFYRGHTILLKKFHPELKKTLPSHLEKTASLTQKERNIVELLLDGKSNTEISSIQNISLSTTKGHIHRIFKKLGIKHRMEILTLAENYSS